MSTTMTALVAVLVAVGVLGLGALEIWLFWKLGECEVRRRAERAGAVQPAMSPRERRRDEHDRPVIARGSQLASARDDVVGTQRSKAGQGRR